MQSSNVHDGTKAARVGVATACPHATHLFLTDPFIPGSFAACTSISADQEIATGATRLTAGDSATLRPGFSVAAGAALAVEIDRDLYPDAWVQDDNPTGLSSFDATFYLDASNLVLGGAQEFYAFVAFGADRKPLLRLGLKFNQALVERRLYLEVFEEDGSVVTTENDSELALPAGWRKIDLAVNFTGGFAFLCIDAPAPPVGCATLSSIDNDTGAIDLVRWGAIDVPSQSTLGTLDLDEYSSSSFANAFEDGLDPWSDRSHP